MALGAGEYYGCNRNGDYFSTKELKNNYKTFETHAFFFKHHENKDPKKSYGSVVKAYWNNRMKRVELVVAIDDEKAPDIAKKAKEGALIPVSMACRVPYDVCSICGNKAKSISKYCTHLKNNMSEVLSDGRQIYAENINPTFFDISAVFRPADRTAYVLTKVAGVSSYRRSKQGFRKSALLSKLSEIEKEIEGHGSISNDLIEKALPQDSISEEVMDLLKKYSPTKSLSVLAKKGIILSVPDFLRLILPSKVEKEEVSDIQNSCMFKDVLSDEGMFKGLKDIFYPGKLHNIVDKLRDAFSLNPDIAGGRALSISIIKPPSLRIRLSNDGMSSSSSGSSITIGFKKRSSSVKRLADIYMNYKMAGASLCPQYLDDDFFLSLVVSQK